jgi:hypothetical protein
MYQVEENAKIHDQIPGFPCGSIRSGSFDPQFGEGKCVAYLFARDRRF